MVGCRKASCRLWGDSMISLRVQTKSGKIYEVKNSTHDIEWTTQRMDSPGKLDFSIIEDSESDIDCGSSVLFSVDGQEVFFGYIFKTTRNRDGEVSYIAYDQLRYLKANASYVFEAMSLEQIITRIAADFGLKVGTLAETGYAFPCLIKENTSCLDIIYGALAEVIYRTGKIFVFYDLNGYLTLTEVKDMLVTTLLGDKSLVTEYNYTKDIDSDTYNRIKLVKPNESTGRTDVYMYEDTSTQEKWGLLQYYDQVDENMNEAQIEEMCKAYLQYYNRVLQTITLESIGVLGVRAGSILPVRIAAIKELKETRLLLAEKVTHTFDGAHSMSVEVKSFQQLGGVAVVGNEP